MNVGSRVAIIAAAIVLAIWIVVPLYLLVVAVLTAQASSADYPKPFVPRSPTTETLSAFADTLGVISSAVNSLAVALVAIVLALLAGVPAAYVAARTALDGRGGLYRFALAGRVFPIAALAVPLATLFARIGFYDSVLAVGIVHAAIALPFVVLVAAPGFAPAAEGVPARRRFAVAGGVAAAAGLVFLISWNEVFAASVLTVQMRTLPAQIFASLATSPLAFKFASALVLIVPGIVVFLLIRRSIVRVWS
jgi:multiple sugar transport system permease protein